MTIDAQTNEGLKQALKLCKEELLDPAKLEVLDNLFVIKFLSQFGQISEHALRRIEELEKELTQSIPTDRTKKFAKYKAIAEKMKQSEGYNSSTRIFRTWNHVTKERIWWIGTRTFIVDVDIDYVHRIDEETAIYLYKERILGEYMDCVSDLLKERK